LVDVMQSCGMTSLFMIWERYNTYQEDIISLPHGMYSRQLYYHCVAYSDFNFPETLKKFKFRI
jgi:hypothetical protein